MKLCVKGPQHYASCTHERCDPQNEICEWWIEADELHQCDMIKDDPTYIFIAKRKQPGISETESCWHMYRTSCLYEKEYIATINHCPFCGKKL